MTIRATDAAELFVWTDIDPIHEDDFNQWYDKEHMEERVSIPGFLWARRYRATSDNARRYLALYRTDNISVFNSSIYRNAFTKQTAWSNTNFERMQNTKRRVMHVSNEGGFGVGSAVGLIVLPVEKVDITKIENILMSILKIDGILSFQTLDPDKALSTPLPSEDPKKRNLEAVIVIDATTEPAAAAAVRLIIEQLEIDAENGITFNLMWELRSEDLQTITNSTIT